MIKAFLPLEFDHVHVMKMALSCSDKESLQSLQNILGSKVKQYTNVQHGY